MARNTDHLKSKKNIRLSLTQLPKRCKRCLFWGDKARYISAQIKDDTLKHVNETYLYFNSGWRPDSIQNELNIIR